MIIDEEILNSYYDILFNKLQTGTDRISASKYQDLKDSDFPIIIKKIKEHTYHFTRYLKKIHDKRTIYSPCIRDKIVLKYLSDSLIQKYNVKFGNRNHIISHIKSLLEEQISYGILRLDIKSFYESLSTKTALSKIRETSLLSSEEYYLIKEALKGCHNGLPQGLSISAVLSEILMENIDFQLRRLSPRQIFYARYVDDIIILFHDNIRTPTEVVNNVKEILNKMGLTLNEKKEKVIKCFCANNQNSFEYLGYTFSYPQGHSQKLETDISYTKLLKEMDKIENVFKNFKSNQNFNLLRYRLADLTRTNIILSAKYRIPLKKSSSSKHPLEPYKYFIKYGFNDAYKYIDNESDSLKQLDICIKSCILGYCHNLSNKQKRLLYCFSYQNTFKTKSINAYYKLTKTEYIERLLKIDKKCKKNDLQKQDIKELKSAFFEELKIKT